MPDLKLSPIDACSATLFDEKTGLFNDSCFQRDRDRQSVESASYAANNFRDVAACGSDAMSLANCHPNLRFKNGYGFASPCNVDADSQVRFLDQKTTNPKHRQQINTRTAQGGPDLSRGWVAADDESSLLHQEMSRTRRECGDLSGVGTEHAFAPLLPCVSSAQKLEHVVPGWTTIDTRAWVRDADVSRRCGFDQR